MEPHRYTPGCVPVIISIPHTGTHVPDAILERLTPAAKQLPDTDWHVERLYGFARDMGVHTLAATHSRYVVDLNRAPDNESLYPGKFTTGLCPETLFDGSPLYREGQGLKEGEVNARLTQFWMPYHEKLQSLIAELKARHGKVVLFDAHSICSVMPTLFEGTLPDLNLGTADGATCDPQLAQKLVECCKQSGFSWVHNGRFKGGYITRNYGKPGQGVDAVQLELAQKNYMQETAPYDYDEAKALRLQEALRKLLAVLVGSVVG